MPKRRPRTRWERGWRPKGAWSFETRDDGTILFFPHGWGRGYVVPTREKRREIETHLLLWRNRVRAIGRFSEPLLALLAVVFLFAIILSFPPFLFTLYIPGWYKVFFGLALAFCVPFVPFYGSYAMMLFLAETSKADLQKSDVRRSFIEMQRNRARRSKWWRLWGLEVIGVGSVLYGIWLLWPRSETVMRPPHVIPAHMQMAVPWIVVGALIGLVVFWLIMLKRKSERTDPR